MCRSKKTIWCAVIIVFAIMLSCMSDITGAQAKPKTMKLTLNMASMAMKKGDRINLRVTQVTPASASKKVTWKSSNKKIASVSKSGQIRAKAKGKATITVRAKSGKAVAKCRIKVRGRAKGKSKVLVAYFSATNTTKGIAEKVANVSGGDLYRITPAERYSAKDLDYTRESCRAVKEQKNKKVRPSMKGSCAGVQQYNTIFVGFPIWSGAVPRLINTFMESYSFAGRTVIPFCTSGGTGIGKAVKTLKSVTKGKVTWRPGKQFDGNESKTEIAKWVNGLHLQNSQPEEPTQAPTVSLSPAPSKSPEVTLAPEKTVSPEATLAPDGHEKVLVAYFSCTGSTKQIAEKIAKGLDADIYEIVPEISYTSADLNYNDSNSRSSVEQKDPSVRPGISGNVSNMEQYETLLMGYPIWHGAAPRIMDTFVESYDFSGKKIIPFCTSASSGIGDSATALQALCRGNATWDRGRRFSGDATETEITDWLGELGLAEEPVETEESKMINIQVGTVNFTAELMKNSSAEAFAEKLAEGPLTVEMHDYGNFEKVGALGFDLPTNNEQITTEPGDVILYMGNQITIYYDTNSWNFTRLGKIQGVTKEELKSALGAGDVIVTFSLA